MKKSNSAHQAMISALLLSCAACAPMFGASPNYEIRPVQTASNADISPDFGEYQLASQAITQRDYGLALTHLQAARDMDPHDVRVLNAFGVVYDKLGRFDLSKRYYAQAETLDPKSEIVARNMAYSKVLEDVQNGASLASELASLPALPSKQEVALEETRAGDWVAASNPLPPVATSQPQQLVASQTAPEEVAARGLHDSVVAIAQLSQPHVADSVQATPPAEKVMDVRLADASIAPIKPQQVNMPLLDQADPNTTALPVAIASQDRSVPATDLAKPDSAARDQSSAVTLDQELTPVPTRNSAALPDQEKVEEMPIMVMSSDTFARPALQLATPTVAVQQPLTTTGPAPEQEPAPPRSQSPNATATEVTASNSGPAAQVTALPPGANSVVLREKPFSVGQSALAGENWEPQVVAATPKISDQRQKLQSVVQKDATPQAPTTVADVGTQGSGLGATSQEPQSGELDANARAPQSPNARHRWWQRQIHSAIQWLGDLFDNRNTQTREAAAHPVVKTSNPTMASFKPSAPASLATQGDGPASLALAKPAATPAISNLRLAAALLPAIKPQNAPDTVLLLGHPLPIVSVPRQGHVAEAIRQSLSSRGWSVTPVSFSGVSKADHTAVYYVQSQEAVAQALARTLNAPVHLLTGNCGCGDLRLVIGDDVMGTKLASLASDKTKAEKLAFAGDEHFVTRGGH